MWNICELSSHSGRGGALQARAFPTTPLCRCSLKTRVLCSIRLGMEQSSLDPLPSLQTSVQGQPGMLGLYSSLDGWGPKKNENVEVG